MPVHVPAIFESGTLVAAVDGWLKLAKPKIDTLAAISKSVIFDDFCDRIDEFSEVNGPIYYCRTP